MTVTADLFIPLDRNLDYLYQFIPIAVIVLCGLYVAIFLSLAERLMPEARYKKFERNSFIAVAVITAVSCASVLIMLGMGIAKSNSIVDKAVSEFSDQHDITPLDDRFFKDLKELYKDLGGNSVWGEGRKATLKTDLLYEYNEETYFTDLIMQSEATHEGLSITLLAPNQAQEWEAFTAGKGSLNGGKLSGEGSN